MGCIIISPTQSTHSLHFYSRKNKLSYFLITIAHVDTIRDWDMNRLVVWLRSLGIFQRKNLQEETEFTRNILHCPECGKSEIGKVNKDKRVRDSRRYEDKSGQIQLTTGRTISYFKTAHCQGCKKEVYKTIEYGWIIIDIKRDRFYQIT